MNVTKNDIIARFTIPAECREYLRSIENVANRMDKAINMLEIAMEPRFRFGLTKDQTVVVIPCLNAIIIECHYLTRPA